MPLEPSYDTSELYIDSNESDERLDVSSSILDKQLGSADKADVWAFWKTAIFAVFGGYLNFLFSASLLLAVLDPCRRGSEKRRFLAAFRG